MCQGPGQAHNYFRASVVQEEHHTAPEGRGGGVPPAMEGGRVSRSPRANHTQGARKGLQAGGTGCAKARGTQGKGKWACVSS